MNYFRFIKIVFILCSSWLVTVPCFASSDNCGNWLTRLFNGEQQRRYERQLAMQAAEERGGRGFTYFDMVVRERLQRQGIHVKSLQEQLASDPRFNDRPDNQESKPNDSNGQ